MPGCEDFGHEFLRKWSLLRGVNPPDFLGETGKRIEFVNWDYDIPDIGENKIDVPNHQPVNCFDILSIH